MFAARPSHVPVYLMHGFGDFGDTETSVEGLLSVIANAVSMYLKPTTVTPTVTTQTVATQSASIGEISPIYLIGGGLLAWYLIKKRKGVKKTKEVI
jgi:hypothetical protein